MKNQLRLTFQAITAAAGEPGRFTAVVAIEGVRTTDDREVAFGALSWRELPIPVTNAEDTGDDHYGEIVGRIETMERFAVSGTQSEIRATGTFDMSTDAGVEADALVNNQMKRWVSMDLEIISYELVEEGDCSIDTTPDDEIDYYPNPDCHIIMRVTEGRIMGMAMCAFPAFPGCVIVPEGAEIPAATPDGRPAADTPAAVPPALAASAPVYPPAEWFERPENLEAGNGSINIEGGRIFGYIAPWDVCHIGVANACVTAPASVADYAYFRTGAVKVECEDGCEIATGTITMNTGHASLAASPADTIAHYDNSGFGVADVVCGEDTHGIWFSGALRPGITDEQIRTLRASKLSGDWRRIGGNLELVAALVVNTPGFPVPRTAARVASGEQTALVAAGVSAPAPVTMAELAEQVGILRAQVDTLRAQITVTQGAFKPLRTAAAAAIRERVERMAVR